mmetsp:Transcript_6032/g.10712  ORF Transcript_6032/g.10712 Transcript_6032/m.10712 type:complete len:893 (-) Transcript_6032:332-3010(-)
MESNSCTFIVSSSNQIVLSHKKCGTFELWSRRGVVLKSKRIQLRRRSQLRCHSDDRLWGQPRNSISTPESSSSSSRSALSDTLSRALLGFSLPPKLRNFSNQSKQHSNGALSSTPNSHSHEHSHHHDQSCKHSESHSHSEHCNSTGPEPLVSNSFQASSSAATLAIDPSELVSNSFESNSTSSQASCACSGGHSEGAAVKGTGIWASMLRWVLGTRSQLNVAILASVLLLISFVLARFNANAIVFRALLGLSLVITGIPALIDSVNLVLKRNMNVDVLMTLAALLSVVSGNPFEGALLMALYSLSHSAEIVVTERARGDLDALQELAPRVAYRLANANSEKAKSYESVKHPETNGNTANSETVSVDDVIVDDILLVKAGELAPCDCIVVGGTAYVAMEHITGEQLPRSVSEGEEIPAGARTLDSSLVVKVLRVGAESTISRMVRLVTEAQQNRPKLQGFLDRFGRTYSQVIIACSVLIAVSLPLISRLAGSRISVFGSNGSFSRALGFLVAASPCALIIGAPVAYLSALSACARRGVLVKGGARTIEALSSIDKVVFDKTGTLTTGDPLLKDIQVYRASASSIENESEIQKDQRMIRQALSVATALEGQTVHPLARAVLAEADRSGVSAVHVNGFKSHAGQGLEAVADLEGSGDFVKVVFGKVEYLCSQDSLLDADQIRWLENEGALATSQGESIAAYASGRGDLALFRFVDELREDAHLAVETFRMCGLETGMLTGDKIENAERIAKSLGGLDHLWAGLRPEEKLTMIQKLSENDGRLLFVGDGMNDAPALAAATAGASMGLEHASATAVHASDIVICRQKLSDISWFYQKSIATQRIVKQNVMFALLLMCIAATPAVCGAIPLWLAVTLHEGSTVLVGLNGLRLLHDRLH